MVNGGFEVVGAFLVLNHIRVAFKDKKMMGISLVSQIIFTIWGLWNIVWYSYLNTPLSFAGSLLLMAMNAWWTWLMIYYNYIRKSE